MRQFIRTLSFWLSVLGASSALACVDSVVLVHGNTGSPDDWDNTYIELRARGVPAGQIHRLSWGSSCAACNDHNGSEETPVLNALVDALASSCTGRIDVIGHSMGVTLAAKQIVEYGLSGQVDAFVGIAGAWRGLWTCGVYPFNVWNSTCGYYGLSVSSPLLDWLNGNNLGARVYSIKSWADQVVCATGTCLVNGVHSSRLSGESATFTFPLGHFGLQSGTPITQVDLIL